MVREASFSIMGLPYIRITSDRVSPDSLVALGLLGDISALTILFQQLSQENLAESAALELYCITGADLFEEVFIPEEIDKDELFEEELAKLERGESLYSEDESPPGITINRIFDQIFVIRFFCFTNDKIWIDVNKNFSGRR